MNTSNPDPPDNANDKPHDNHERGGQPAPSAAILANDPRQARPNSPQPHTEAAKQQRDGYDKAQIVLLGLTFVAALGAAIFTGLLWRSTDDLVLDAQRTAQRQLRAYVFVDKANVVLEGRTLKASVELRNSGQTPAYDLTTISKLETDEGDKPFTPSAFSKEAKLSRGIVGPGTTIIPRAELAIPPENSVIIPALQDRRAVIYLIGKTQYRDAFNREWILDFRFRSHHAEGAVWILEATENGNVETQKK